MKRNVLNNKAADKAQATQARRRRGGNSNEQAQATTQATQDHAAAVADTLCALIEHTTTQDHAAALLEQGQAQANEWAEKVHNAAAVMNNKAARDTANYTTLAPLGLCFDIINAPLRVAKKEQAEKGGHNDNLRPLLALVGRELFGAACVLFAGEKGAQDGVIVWNVPQAEKAAQEQEQDHAAEISAAIDNAVLLGEIANKATQATAAACANNKAKEQATAAACATATATQATQATAAAWYDYLTNKATAAAEKAAREQKRAARRAAEISAISAALLREKVATTQEQAAALATECSIIAPRMDAKGRPMFTAAALVRSMYAKYNDIRAAVMLGEQATQAEKAAEKARREQAKQDKAQARANRAARRAADKANKEQANKEQAAAWCAALCGCLAYVDTAAAVAAADKAAKGGRALWLKMTQQEQDTANGATQAAQARATIAALLDKAQAATQAAQAAQAEQAAAV